MFANSFGVSTQSTFPEYRSSRESEPVRSQRFRNASGSASQVAVLKPLVGVPSAKNEPSGCWLPAIDPRFFDRVNAMLPFTRIALVNWADTFPL